MTKIIGAKIAGRTLPYDAQGDLAYSRHEIEVALNAEKKKLKKFLRAVQSDNKARIRKALHYYLGSHYVLLANVFEATVERLVDKRSSPEECIEIAEALHKSKLRPKGVVHVDFKDKQSGGQRPISSFGLSHRACQLLVKKLLSLFINLEDWHYDFRGQQVAAENIRTAMNEGFDHLKRMDIENFFGSFNSDEILKNLPTPIASNQIVNILNLENEELCLHNNRYNKFSSFTLARRGIPQGAICSSYYAAFVLSHLRIEIPEDIRLFVYVDDFLVMGKSLAGVEAFAEALVSAVADVPGGHFILREKGGSHD